MADEALTVQDLRRVIHDTPVIDNHAHNILHTDQLKQGNFLSATSEATGNALEDHITSLPHLRALKQLRELYDLPKDADWDAILVRRKELLDQDAKSLIRKCLAGTQTILVDDGLIGSFHPYDWHNQFVASPCKRIVRIEAIASEILHALHKADKLPIGVAIADTEACYLAWVAFITAFEEAIVAYLDDEEVVGFKSVICYRTGLDIETGSDVEVTETALRSFARHFLPRCAEHKFRIETKGMNDALVISVCKLLQAAARQNGAAKPLQFHTGLGDNDISLLDSNPAVMQNFIKLYSEVPIVLLHSAYPYTREAGYLVTVYKNVYLDLGEVFPQVSRNGQEQIIRQALEIAPTSKLLWSTDGHHFPETYYLANAQGRAALEKVLCEYVQEGDLSIPEAVKVARRILFENSNDLYKLDLQAPILQRHSIDAADAEHDNALKTHVVETKLDHTGLQHMQLLYENDIKYVIVQWLDYMAQLRSRWFPVKAFKKLTSHEGGRFAISHGNLGTTPNDRMSPACNPVDSIYVEADPASFRIMQSTGPVKKAATVMARFANATGKPLDLCPRARLQCIAQDSRDNHGINFLLGFEIEVILCHRESFEATGVAFSPLDTNHSWGTLSDQQYTTSFEVLTAIVESLADIGVHVEQFHSEAGAGQYEFVLPPLPLVEAVDTLIQSRQCIQQIASLYGYRATYHPMPFPGFGTAAHAHISLNSTTLTAEELKAASDSFAAFVLTQLPAICAFTMPQEVSYSRVVDDSWTGGTWVAWGTNNRETPLRRVNDTRWELRCIDGLANMYLALGAIISVGLLGLRYKTPLKMQDCSTNPSKLSELDRHHLGIFQRLPRSLEDALAALEVSVDLKDALGSQLVKDWLQVERATVRMLNGMPEAERRVWLMERY